MDATAATMIGKRLAEGAAETLRAMLGTDLQLIFEDTETVEGAALPELTESLPIALASTLSNNGGIALLLRREAALHMAAMLQEEGSPAPAALGETERSLLADLGEAVLGGALANLLESLGQEFGQLRQSRVVEDDEAARVLPDLLKARPQLCRLNLQDNAQLAGPVALLFSQSFEDLSPGATVEAGPAGQSPLLSDEEMQDILGGIGMDTEFASPARRPPEYGENLEVVLDITLTAVARLGGIELPISEILTLGPGAVIEVGHLVDDPVELLVNGRLIARGEVVVVDEKFGLRITEIISPRMRIESLR